MKIKNTNIRLLLKVIVVFALLLNTDLCFGNSFSRQSTDTVKAWAGLINNAQIREDQSILSSVSNLLDDATIPITVTGQIGEIVEGLAAGGYKCRTCATQGTGYRYIDELVVDLTFVQKIILINQDLQSF